MPQATLNKIEELLAQGVEMPIFTLNTGPKDSYRVVYAKAGDVEIRIWRRSKQEEPSFTAVQIKKTINKILYTTSITYEGDKLTCDVSIADENQVDTVSLTQKEAFLNVAFSDLGEAVFDKTRTAEFQLEATRDPRFVLPLR